MIEMSQLSLRITAEKNGNILIAAKNRGKVSIETIEFKLLMAHCWWEDLPAVDTFLNVLEATIKKTINDVYSQNGIILDYNYIANDIFADASMIEIQINELEANGEEFEVFGRFITLEGADLRGFFRKISAFRRKLDENVRIEL